MESIFDYNPTEEEIIDLFGFPTSREKIENIFNNEEDQNILLYRLFSNRGEDQKARKYHAKIKDTDLAFDLQYKDLIF